MGKGAIDRFSRIYSKNHFKSFAYLSVFAVLIFTLSAFPIQDAHAATVTAVATGDWNNAGTWDVGIPSSTDAVIIPSGKTVTIPSGLTVTVDPAGSIDVNNVLNVVTGGTLDNSGTITITGSGAGINVVGGSFMNSGSVTINIGSGLNTNAPGGSFTNDGSVIVHGGFRGTGTMTNNNLITNDGTGGLNGIYIFAGAFTGTLTNSATGTITSSGIFSNAGTIGNSGIITDNYSITNNSGGLITNNSGGLITNNSGGFTNNGTIANSGTITNAGLIINNLGGIITNNTGGIINSGAINNFGTINNSGTIHNTNTTITNNSGGIINNNSGGIIDNDTNSLITNSGTINNNLGGIIDNQGTITISNIGGNGIRNFSTIENSGTITISNIGGNGINNGGAIINNNSGGIIHITSLVTSGSGINNSNSGTITNFSGGTIMNDGIIRNNLATIINKCGAIYSGNAPAVGNPVIFCPLAPSTPDLTTGSDSGSSSADDITNFNPPTFTVGGVVSGYSVQLYVGAVASGSPVVASGSSVTLASGTLTPDGVKLITAKATNSAGTGPASTALSVTIDTVASAPTALDLSIASDSGSSSTDNITKDNTPNINGLTAEAGSVALTSSLDGSIGTATAASPWNTDTSILSDGTHSITAVLTDVAGNISPASTALSVTIDTIAPSPILAINGNTPPDRTFSTSVSLQTTCGDGVIGSGCDTFVVGGTGITNPTVGPSEPFAASRAATLTVGRDPAKSAEISSVTDKAGNTAAGPFSDTIALDARILTVVPSTTTPYWGVDLNINGTVENALTGDLAKVRFGSPTLLSSIAAGAFGVTGQYPQLSLEPNPHTPNATLTDASNIEIIDSTGTRVSKLGSVVTVQRHPTTVLLNPISDTYAGDLVAATGILVDDITGLGISGKTITFSGNGSAPLSPATTTNFTVNDAGGITVADYSGDLILRGKVNTEFIFPTNPATVILTLREMGVNTFNVTVTTGDTTKFNATGEGQGINTGIFTLSDAQGISNITITYVSSGTAGITQVEALNSNVIEYIDEGFTTLVSGLPTTTLPFAQGSFISVGTAQATVTNNLVVNATFAVNTNYEASASTDDPQTNVKIYSVHYATGAGSGGAVAVVADSGTGRTAVQCGAGNDDDLDALCDDWEGTVANGKGIPIVGGGLYNLPGSNPNKKDIYVEIDYMYGHNPFVTGSNNDAIDNVTAAFAKAPVTNVGGESNGITLHVDKGEVLHHDDILNVWTDADSNSTNDFNSVKAANFGCQNNSDCAVPNESTAQKDAKSKAYHYFLFAHSMGGASGVAEQWGNDGIVSLGVNFGEVNVTHSGTEGTVNQTAGTFMHELGHNLNLGHGGPVAAANADSGDNCKPNHDSVMTYSRQLPTLLGNLWVLNYSDGGLGPAAGLKESGGSGGNIAELNQTVSFPTVSGNLVHSAVSISPSTRPYVIWGTPSSSYASVSGTDIGLAATPSNTFSYIQSRANAQLNAQPKDIDWNGDGTIQTGTNLARDINAFGFFGCENNLPLTTYSFKNYNEWTALNYNFTNVPGGQYDGFAPTVNTYQIAFPDLDSTQVGQLKVLNAYQQEVSPWDKFSSITRKANTDIVIKTQLFDGENLRITGSDTTVTFKLYKSGSLTVLKTGTLVYESGKTPPHWHSPDVKTPIVKGTYFIEIIVDNPGTTPPTKTTKDPDRTYTNVGRVMSMQLIVN